MTDKVLEKCPRCHQSRQSVQVCDNEACRKEALEHPVKVTSSRDGDWDEDHFCSLRCVAARGYDTDGLGSWLHISVRVSSDAAGDLLDLLADRKRKEAP